MSRKNKIGICGNCGGNIIAGKMISANGPRCEDCHFHVNQSINKRKPLNSNKVYEMWDYLW